MTISTRTRLLTAAEKILVEQGVNALSVRKVGESAQLNPTLVTYHFKSILNLLDELCTLNLEPMLERWQVIQPDNPRDLDIDEILEVWLEPMRGRAALTPNGRALTVLDEIAAHGETALRAKVLGAMEEFALRLRTTMQPLLPHLAVPELRARLRFISAAVLGPPPRTYHPPPTDGSKALDDVEYLLPFARAALSLPALSRGSIDHA